MECVLVKYVQQHIQKYYMNEYKCDDPMCDFSTYRMVCIGEDFER